MQAGSFCALAGVGAITVRDDTRPAAAKAIISFMDGSLLFVPLSVAFSLKDAKQVLWPLPPNGGCRLLNFSILQIAPRTLLPPPALGERGRRGIAHEGRGAH
jgi:hypothetical protein